MEELWFLKLCALLHDVGKLRCWARGKDWSEHVQFTYEMLKDVLDKELAISAMRHHASRTYHQDFHPKTSMEHIVHLADMAASGADRVEEAYRRSPRPKPPIELSYILSKGLRRFSFNAEELEEVSAEVLKTLETNKELLHSDIQAGYRRLFEELCNGRLSQIPAYTQPPINDTDLFSHMKLTAAIATCIFLSGFQPGKELENYEFVLVRGDADRVQNYLNSSKRLPDLTAGSRIIKEATEASANVFEERLGPDCVLYRGGGNFLALSPPLIAEGLRRSSEKAFEDLSHGQLSITIILKSCVGAELQNFGKIWEDSYWSLRERKTGRPLLGFKPITPQSEPCAVCGVELGTFSGRYKAAVDSYPRLEFLCEKCLKRRQLGEEQRGIDIDGLVRADEESGGKGFIGILKMDGDHVGKVFSGKKLKEDYSKNATPARLASFSRFLHGTFESELRELVEKSGGRTVYAGGDDLLAILLGGKVFDVALEAERVFRRKTGLTLSAGVVLAKKGYPIYLALEAVSKLLDNAKTAGRSRLDYEIVWSISYTEQDLSLEGSSKRRLRLSGRPYSWEALTEMLDLVRRLREKTPSTQLRELSRLIQAEKTFAKDAAEFYLRRQFAREVISWEEMGWLKSLVERSMLLDVLELLKVIT